MKKNGFTLIELLAVIVVLAIIALIATPMVLNTIEETRKGAAKASALSYIESVELYIATNQLNNKESLKPGKEYNLTQTTIIDAVAYPALNEVVNLKGSKPTGQDDYIILDQNYLVVSGIITIDGYKIEISGGKIDNVIKGEKIKVTDIILNFDSQTMEKGSETNIEVTFEPAGASNQEVTYKSSNEDVVTVTDKGVITAVSTGTATITVTSKDDDSITKSITIKVILPENVESVSIESEEESVSVGSSLQLTAVLEPLGSTTNAVAWESSDSSVAMVSDSGKVTGLMEGTVTITVTTANGKTASVTITVKSINIVCKRATTLHTNDAATITYGSLGTSGTLTSGDAFDCDVNGDGTYDSETERFYYVTDLDTNSNYAVLIYYDNTASQYLYGLGNMTLELPTTDEWSNVSLSNTSRIITTETGSTSTVDGEIENPFSYEGYAARLLTVQEVNEACGITVGSSVSGELDSCFYLTENSPSSTITNGYFLENYVSSSSASVWIINSNSSSVESLLGFRVDSNGNYWFATAETRPVIEVLKDNILF